jgi:PKD repeat protein
MKKFLYLLIAFAVVSLTACNKDDDDNTGADKPGPVKITYEVNGNVVNYHAEAENAVSYAWDLGNGETPTGQDVNGTYAFPGEYTVKCTAKGRVEDTQATETVKVEEGDPDIFSDVNVLLSGYNAEPGESEAVWTWTDAPGVFADGPRISVPDTVYFNPIDYSWWQNEGGDIDSLALDDKYQFKLNPKMEYVNNFGTAFMVNWAWAAVRGHHNGEIPGIWEDVAWEGYNNGQSPMIASWNVEYIPNIDDNVDSLSFETQIGDQMKPGAYVIHLTNQASLGMESTGYDYQILKLTEDTLWVRFDNTFPENLGDYYNIDDLMNEGAIPGDPDESYLKLVRKK